MEFGLPIIFVVLLWYFSTGAVLWLARGEKGTIPLRLLGVTMLAAVGFAGTLVSANHEAAWVPYLAVASAIAVWAWAEFTFLTGLLTGPRVARCPAGVSEWVRFKLAFRTISRHEFVLVGALIAMFAVSYTGINRAAVWTFLVLWLMRISAKLTIFSGAPSVSVEMMPEQLSHMTTYFRHDRIGPFFWIATAASTLTLVAGVAAFHVGLIAPIDRAITIMLTTLIALAALEHWLMILPIKDSLLWRWAMGKTPDLDQEKPIKIVKKLGAAE